MIFLLGFFFLLVFFLSGLTGGKRLNGKTGKSIGDRVGVKRNGKGRGEDPLREGKGVELTQTANQHRGENDYSNL